jgi:hypothetical protein
MGSVGIGSDEINDRIDENRINDTGFFINAHLLSGIFNIFSINRCSIIYGPPGFKVTF